MESTRTPLLDAAAPPQPRRWTWINRKSCTALLGPAGALTVYLIAKANSETSMASEKIAATLGALVWIALWWILEPVPLAISSLLPLVLFPFLGIMEADEVAGFYANDIVMLMLGTFILALGIERCGLHKRMALKILLVFGGQTMDPRLVLLGFCAGTTFVSMWMSNTSAAAMMIPVATGVLNNLKPVCDVESPSSSTSSHRALQDEVKALGVDIKKEDEIVENEKDDEVLVFRYSQGVILGVTFATAIGGMATLIGCGTNVLMPGLYHERFPKAPQITFFQWSKFSFPIVVIFLLLEWWFLCWFFCPPSTVRVLSTKLNRQLVEKQYQTLGPMTFAEKFIFVEFLILIIMWVTRSFGSTPGWGYYFDNLPNDGTVAILAAMILFLVPNKVKEGEMLMDWKSCKGISWSVILILGGGFALSKGIQTSGLSTKIGVKMHFLENVPYYFLTPILSLIINISTEFSSNVAIATLFLPIMAEVAVSINYHPLLLMIPATFSSNSAFMLPSGTPPNALAHSTGYIPVKAMLMPGLVMHIFSLILLSIFTPTLGAYIFGVNIPASSLPWIF